MTNNEFLEDIVSYIKQEYAEFEEYQKVAIDVLREVERVLNKHEVPFILSNGTLLGYVRDSQIVPWDYDVDIATPICNKQKLLNSLQQSLGEDYYYKYIDNTADYPTTCIRVSKKGYTFMAIHVDIFFMIGISANKKEQDKLFRLVQRWTGLRTEKYIENYLPFSVKGRLKKTYLKVRSFLFSLIPDSYLRRKEERICSTLPFENSEYCISFARHRAGIELHRSDFFRNLKRVNTEKLGDF